MRETPISTILMAPIKCKLFEVVCMRRVDCRVSTDSVVSETYANQETAWVSV